MDQRQYCIYCGKQITTRSSEHVIQNALGGLYESTDICCPECNNYISKHIDAPFTKIFNPIISRIDNFSKTNNTKSLPPCTGKVIYDGKIYDANIKGGKVVSCPELSRELHCDISKLPLQIVAYDFNLQNSAFQTGIAKIAFNYALAQNVDFKYLEPGLQVDKSENVIHSISYNYPTVPFSPLNPVDVSIELDHPVELYHNIILFSQHNELWCYVDLFNTFQFYVLLSDTLPSQENIYANYTQTLQKLNRTNPILYNLSDPKEVLIYAQQYGVAPCMDPQEFSRRVNNAVARKSQKIPMTKIISPRINGLPVRTIIKHMRDNPKQMFFFYNALQLYFADDELQEQNFRTLTSTFDTNIISSYPHALADTYATNTKLLQKYTTQKFNKLNNFLCRNVR